MINLSYARGKRSENGLGLFDIRPEADALVLVGSRKNMVETKDALRHQYREKNGIHIHTYDWLIEAIAYSLHYSGLPIANSYILGNTPSYE